MATIAACAPVHPQLITDDAGFVRTVLCFAHHFGWTPAKYITCQGSCLLMCFYRLSALPEQDQVKDMLAWLDLRAAVLMKLDRREDAATVYRCGYPSVALTLWTSIWMCRNRITQHNLSVHESFTMYISQDSTLVVTCCIINVNGCGTLWLRLEHRQLLRRYPDNARYHTALQRAMGLEPASDGGWSGDQLAALQALYDELQAEYPRSTAAFRIPLDYLVSTTATLAPEGFHMATPVTQLSTVLSCRSDGTTFRSLAVVQWCFMFRV